MTLKQCYMTGNTMYTKINRKPEKFIGIVVHSTGANNPNLCRYVQPDADDPKRTEILQDINVNTNGNSWNRDVGAGVHAFIGKNKDGNVETYETLTYDLCAGGVGKGRKGSYNYAPTAHIQFEICEDNLTDMNYFNAVWNESVEYCEYLCKKFELSADSICSHKECADRGYGTSHGDPEHWFSQYGRSMDDFRKAVSAKLIDSDTEEWETVFEDTNYRLQRRKSLCGTN